MSQRALGDIAHPLRPPRIRFAGETFRVVDHDRGLRRQTREQDDVLAIPRLQHVEVDPHMRLEPTLAGEGRFTGCLDAAEDDGFHSVAPAAVRLVETTAAVRQRKRTPKG